MALVIYPKNAFIRFYGADESQSALAILKSKDSIVVRLPKNVFYDVKSKFFMM